MGRMCNNFRLLAISGKAVEEAQKRSYLSLLHLIQKISKPSVTKRKPQFFYGWLSCW